MLHVNLRGTPYDIGYQHGTTLKPLVDGIVRHLLPKNNRAAIDTVLPALAFVKQTCPELLAEMKGIANGSGISFDEIVMLNFTVLHYCTVIAFEGSDVGPILGKNFDFPGYAFQTLFTVTPERGHSFVHLGCAGCVASYGGINSKGLAMGHSVVFLKEEQESDGIPVSFVRRLALQYCGNTNEAVEYVSSVQTHAVADNIVFLDQHGTANVIEKQPRRYQVRKSDHGHVYCTNTFVDAEHSAYIDKESEGFKRYRALGNLLSTSELTEATMKSVLSSKNGEFPICRKSTQVSFIAYPKQLVLQVSDGTPGPDLYSNFKLTVPLQD